MLKLFFPFCLLFVFGQAMAQLEKDKENNIIVYVSSSKNTNLFFPTPIESGVLGKDNYEFAFSDETKTKLGILRGTQGPETNLLVTTIEGNVYSFIVRYSEDLQKLNYFMSLSDKIGNMNGDTTNTEGEKKENNNLVSKNISVNDYNAEAKTIERKNESTRANETNELYKFIIEKGRYYKRYYSEATGVKLHLYNIFNDNGGNLFFYLKLENSSSVTYQIDTIEINIVASNSYKKTSTQTIPIEPITIYKEYANALPNSSSDYIIVVNKFTINKEKQLQIKFSELTGERDLELVIPNQYINNPNSK
ncbi:uncharacterized protein DUF4138 [Flavobacterium croceum DSM 17960]|uniref:Uncharacterized protein DUF4138 n=1 Tax=Flavobacterium croceum DSM 17960 TaxID=1121886 RepID=A0A2S4N5D3_9FLAO|nr:DUF4138 domain-containing protein [Flavobacterium croceum]POS00901.1 uncharacterized protein DUF4138 [Flavobacterium croceum DSM 17960]